MKDLTDREPLDAVARAMKIVVECFQAQRERRPKSLVQSRDLPPRSRNRSLPQNRSPV